jgi:sugar lactone lactonase YvrE
MQRRFALPLFAAVGLAALTGSRVGTAQETATPGTITTVAGTGQRGFSGDGGPATQARLHLPSGVVVDAAGNLFIADAENNRVRKVSPAGMIATVVGTGQLGFSGDGGLATEARLNFPIGGLALDKAGNLFIGDSGNNRVRKVSADGMITTVAGRGSGFSGDGGPATEARFDGPSGIAVDAAGNLFIADGSNHRIRKVSPDGLVTTVAGSGPTGRDKGVSAGDGGLATEARLNGPSGLTLDRSGNLFFSETGDVFGTNRGYRVRKVSAAGIITTVAGSDTRGFSGDGGPATQARLDSPQAVAVDTAGNLFIADWGNYRVRKVDPNGIITTVAGIGNQRYAGDGVLATATGLRGPLGLAVDAVGNLLFTDSAALHEGLGTNERVLKVFGAAAPGLIAGEPFPIP